jgi:hypothetical protein
VIVHDEAFVAAVDAVSGLVTFEGQVIGRPDRYTLIHPRETRAVSRFTGPHSMLTNEYVVKSVGSTPQKSKQARELMLEAVLDKVLVTSGWRNGRVYFITSQPLALDSDVDPGLWYTTDVLAFESERLPT